MQYQFSISGRTSPGSQGEIEATLVRGSRHTPRKGDLDQRLFQRSQRVLDDIFCDGDARCLSVLCCKAKMDPCIDASVLNLVERLRKAAKRAAESDQQIAIDPKGCPASEKCFEHS